MWKGSQQGNDKIGAVWNWEEGRLCVEQGPEGRQEVGRKLLLD